MTNIYKPGRLLKTVLLGYLLVNIWSCNRDRNNPGWDYFPDMFYSTAYETNTTNPNFADGMTMRTPVPGTVARDITPFEYTNDPESRILAGKELANPFLLTPETLSRGKVVYTTFCIGCHGIAGNGDGRLFTSGLYPLKPLTLSGDQCSEAEGRGDISYYNAGYTLYGSAWFPDKTRRQVEADFLHKKASARCIGKYRHYKKSGQIVLETILVLQGLS
jgi:hypothetical protein